MLQAISYEATTADEGVSVAGAEIMAEFDTAENLAENSVAEQAAVAETDAAPSALCQHYFVRGLDPVAAERIATRLCDVQSMAATQ